MIGKRVDPRHRKLCRDRREDMHVAETTREGEVGRVVYEYSTEKTESISKMFFFWKGYCFSSPPPYK